MDRKAQAALVLKLLAFGARLSRHPLGRVLATPFFAGLGHVAARAKGVRPAATPRALAQEWQKGFPSRKPVPIVAVDARTAWAEIHTPCPLRGSGDTQACHRMMAYDRAVAARAGGQFVVLESQATPGVTVCKVALRRQGESMVDLPAAHLRDILGERRDG